MFNRYCQKCSSGEVYVTSMFRVLGPVGSLEKYKSCVQGAGELLAAAEKYKSSVEGTGELLVSGEKYNSCVQGAGELLAAAEKENSCVLGNCLCC